MNEIFMQGQNIIPQAVDIYHNYTFLYTPLYCILALLIINYGLYLRYNYLIKHGREIESKLFLNGMSLYFILSIGLAVMIIIRLAMIKQ
jgi:hypothetical protein